MTPDPKSLARTNPERRWPVDVDNLPDWLKREADEYVRSQRRKFWRAASCGALLVLLVALAAIGLANLALAARDAQVQIRVEQAAAG